MPYAISPRAASLEPHGSPPGAKTAVTGRSSAARRSRTLLVTFLGSVVRRFDGWMPIAGAVELLGQCGLDDPSVRTAVSRLKKRGWLEAETRAGQRGYRLTDVATSNLAAGDAVIWHARQPADPADGWCVVTFSVPESARAKRHQLRSHLSALGFGNASAAVWIAPSRMLPSAQEAISELELTDYCAIFAGQYVAGKDVVRLVHEAWDLAAIQQRYREFIQTYSRRADELPARTVGMGQDAFTDYLDVIDQWRRLPFSDPALPIDVLPPDWAGPRAAALFEQLVAALEPAALTHSATHWPTQG